MSSRPDHPELSETEGGVILSVHVQPGAGRTGVVGRHGDALKVKVGAPPTGNRANDEVIALVAREFDVKPAAVSITSGASSRQKRLKLDGVKLPAAEKAVDQMLAGVGQAPTKR